MLIDKIRLEDDEEILLKTRRHWFILASRLAIFGVLALAPLVIILLVPTLLSELAVSFNGYTAPIVFAYSMWLLLLWIGIFNVWTNYYLDVLIVTDRRVIVTDQKGSWRRYVASFRLERMQDINIEIDGFLATLLDFGTLDVETAGHGDAEFHVNGMPNPREIKATILGAGDGRINRDGL